MGKSGELFVKVPLVLSRFSPPSEKARMTPFYGKTANMNSDLPKPKL